MTTPPPPIPSQLYSYTAFQQAQGDNTFPGTQLDADLANLIGSCSAIIGFINSAFRSDGRLANGFVTREALGADIRIGFEPPTPWATATAYAINDAVYYLNAFYFCNTAHTSSAFATDLANGLWTLAADFEQAAEAALIDFEKKYLGAFDTPPTLDNTGQPLETGALYFDSSQFEMFVWNGTAWQSTVASEARRREVIADAAIGQTTFAVAGGFSPNQADVWVDGVKMRRGADYSASSGENIVFTSPLSGGEFVNIVAYAAANLVYTTSDLVGYDAGTGGATRTVEDVLRQFRNVKDYGALGDGEADDSTAFTLMSGDGPVVVPAGTYLIGLNTTIEVPLVFAPGAKLLRGSGVTITINARIYADPYQHIFDASAEGAFVGTFGSCPLSVGWFGAVPDGSVVDTGTRTNNLGAFRRAVLARHRTNDTGARVVVPDGRWYLSGAASAAITTGGLNIGAGLIQLATGDAFVGSGWDACQIIVGGSSSGNVITIGNTDTQGPPSMVGGFMLVAELGGAYSCRGIAALANGTQLFDLWTSGFEIGILMDSTDQFLRNFVCEYSGGATGHCGLRVTRGSTNITDGTLFLCSDGVVIDHKDGAGPTVIQNVRINNAIGTYGRFGLVCTGVYTWVEASNITVEGQYFTRGFYNANVAKVHLTNCTARVPYTAHGFYIENGTNTALTNCTADVITSGTPSSTGGFYITGTASYTCLNACKAKGFADGAYVNTSGNGIALVGSDFVENKGNGVNVQRASAIRVSACHMFNNGTSGSTGNSGLTVRQDNPYERATIVGCEIIGQNNNVQDKGAVLVCNDSNSKIIFSGNVTSYNGASNSAGDNLDKSGTSVANILGDNTLNVVG